ncbi:MAG: right-handed parallel beta-helix repeat-containing protein, partial [Thermoplasmata archaeon]
IKKHSEMPAFFLFAVLLLGGIVGMAEKVSIVGVPETQEEAKMRGISHPPIHINGNADFANQAASEGWAGNGTAENPYIIEEYEIDANEGSYCIWIRNTDVYFVIRNCVLWNATGFSAPYGCGIVLANVMNGIIENNTVREFSYKGIYLDSSEKIVITSNNVSVSRGTYGIDFWKSHNSTISWNNISTGQCGISLYSNSSNNIIAFNEISYSEDGIYLAEAINTTLFNNKMINCGIVFGGSDIANWNTHEIDMTNTVNGKAIYYYKNLDDGTMPLEAGQIILANCTNLTVAHLNITNATAGIQLCFCRNCTIMENNLSGHAEGGILLIHSNSNTIIRNNVYENGYGGILLSFSTDNNLTENIISNSTMWCGIDLYFSTNNSITNNDVSNNSNYGISVEFSSFNIIASNLFYGNVKYAVRIAYSSTSNSIYHNTFIANGATALRYLSQGVSNDTPNGAKGVNGNSQAYDSVGGNYWYDTTTNEGNYWSNWDGNGWGTPDAYPIDGNAGASDWYPLGSPVSEFSEITLWVFAAIILLCLRRFRRK